MLRFTICDVGDENYHIAQTSSDNVVDDDHIDYKDGSSFAKHMKGKTEARSQFALSKTIKEQREYLPVYMVREELLNVIRENQIVVVVGETGSG